MSHFTKVRSQIRDLEVLRRTAERMGFELKANANARYYAGSAPKALVLKLPGKYDCAFTQEKGTWSIDADWYQGHVANYIGENGNILMQNYAVEKVKLEALQRALSVTEKKQDRDIQLTLTDYETGGQLLVTIKLGGETTFKANGFAGESCMRFKSLEESLGQIQSTETTQEYYQTVAGEVEEYL